MKLKHFYGGEKELQRAMYDIRRVAFPEFLPEEQMVYWQFDPLCEHFIIFDGKQPLGCISVADYTKYHDIHQQFGLDSMIKDYSKNIKLKQVSKLATIPDARKNPSVLMKLLRTAEEETKKDCDFFFGYVAPSKNLPNDKHRFDLGNRYCKISKANLIGIRNHQGIKQHFFGKWIN